MNRALLRKVLATSRLADNQQGFTLVEVLISIVLLAVGMLAVAGMQSTALTNNNFSRDGTIAVQIAEEMVERIRLSGGTSPEDYDGIDTRNTCPAGDPIEGDCKQWKARMIEARLIDLYGTVSVTAEAPVSKSATVTVSVVWGRGNVRSVNYTSILETWGT